MRIGRWVLMGTMLLFPGAMLAQGPPSPAEMQAERAALFAQADADGSGTLSLDEFKTFESLVHDKDGRAAFQAARYERRRRRQSR